MVPTLQQAPIIEARVQESPDVLQRTRLLPRIFKVQESDYTFQAVHQSVQALRLSSTE